MKKLCLISLLIAFSLLCFAGIDEYYSFNATTGTYTPITGTTIDNISSDDALSTAIPIGFSFPFGDAVYTNVMVSSNGWIGLGTGFDSSWLSNELISTVQVPVLAPLWDDTSLAGGSASYLLTGTAPNRIFTVQYQSLQWNYWADNSIDFQVRLYESGKIDFIYGPMTNDPANASASIGINMLPGGTGWFYSITPGVVPGFSTTVESSLISTYPGNGTLYEFLPVVAQPNDMAAVAIVGNVTPSIGNATTYTITVRNRGTSPQSNYQVKLVTSTGTELASVAGPTLAPGLIQDVPLSWTPNAEGPLILRGKVVLTGDQNPNNDLSPGLSITVMPAGINVVTIGSGNEQANMPVNMYWRNSLYETLYYPAEVSMLGTISAITFYNNFVTNLPNKPTKIWLGATTQENLANGWIPSTELQLVFDGNVNYPSGENNIMIPLQTPYTYTGGNLVMMVNRPMDTTYFSSMDVFKCQTVGTQRSRLVYSDSSEYNPAAPPADATVSGQFPKTSLYMTPLSPNPITMISPNPMNFGQLLMNQTRDLTLTIMNGGGGTLGISAFSYSGNPYFSIINPPALPTSLNTGQMINVNVRYAPLGAGLHTGVINITDNQGRTIHTVNISGNALDPTLYTLPYLQTFDAVNIPHMPIDWSKIVNSTSTQAYINTQVANYYSAPNAVSMYNYDDASATLLLIAPPVGPAIQMSGTRVNFWARAASADYPMKVGIMSNSQEADTFTEIQTINLTTTWTEYIVSFASYNGIGKYVAFKHGGEGTYRNLYIDNVTVEYIPEHDLAALSLSGNSTPSVGAPSTYNVSIINRGSVTQSNYLVKLFNAVTHAELASASGLVITPDQIVSVPVSWTPATEGPMQLYGKVFLTGDQNTLNDTTGNINITVFPAGIMAVTIGDGSQMARVPVDMYWRNSLFETLYYPDEMLAFGNISSITFYNNFFTNLPNKPTKIWLGSTTQQDLSAGWIPASQMTLVFDGNVNFPSGVNTIVVPLQTPFTYAGGNLVMMVNRVYDTTYFSSSDNFYSQTIGATRSRNIYSDSTIFDPMSPPTDASLSGVFPKTTFHMTPLSPDPMYFISPSGRDFGTVLLNSTHNQTFTVMNMGGGSLGINSITISGSEYISLQNLPTLPASLNTGQTVTFTARYNPLAAGAHAATITIVDNQGQTRSVQTDRSRTPHTALVSGTCIDPTIVALPYQENFDTVTAPILPVQWTSIRQSTSISAVVQTDSGSSFSEPNSVRFYNYDDPNATLILVAPPYSQAIVTNTTRTKFYARSSNQNDVISVGVLSNPQDAATFTLIQDVQITSTWTEYVVTFGAYTGTGKSIAFKLGSGSAWRQINLDNVMLEVIPQNDLAALRVIGNTTPTVGMAANYTVNIFNWGSNQQTDYFVKLYKQGDIEVSSTPGGQINPGQTLPVTVSWVPDAQGATFIYAKVVLTGDQNNLNDQSPNLELSVQPPGMLALTIGDGSSTGRYPLDMYYMNSLFECLYYPDELSNTIGMIYGIGFYNSFQTNLPNMPTNIWLGTTTQQNLSQGWIPSTALTQVFSGNVDYPSGENLIHISFPEPYLYLEGGNLVLLVERPMDTQYYSSSDVFKTQSVGTDRARNIYSDSTDYDPANPPTGGTVSGAFPKTTFFVIPGGVGHINGTVTGANQQPIPGVAVQFQTGGYQATTNNQGQYNIQNIIDASYNVSFSKYGHITQNHQVVIPEDTTVTLDITLLEMPQVTVSGTIIASDTGLGLNGAAIHLQGYQNYAANTIGTGAFTFPAVYANQTYTYTIVCAGYTNATGSINVASGNYAMGTITLNEIAYAPHNVVAAVNGTYSAVNVSWQAPDPTAIEIVESFESTTFPPTDWSRIITNNGPANTSGVYPTWCSFGAITISGTPVTPTHGSNQAGLWWSYEHQDEWLVTPSFNCPPDAYITFDGYVFLGSSNGDHYYVKVSTNNGNTWDTLWDASTQTGGWNYYASPITVDLSQYSGMQINLAFHAEDPPSNDGLWYVWFIDNIYIGNAVTSVSFNGGTQRLYRPFTAGNGRSGHPTSNQPSRSQELGWLRNEPSIPLRHQIKTIVNTERVLTGYYVWRLLAGQENNPTTWTSLTPNPVTSTTLEDTGWTTLPYNAYRWAVKAVYTAGVLSGASFSNTIAHIAENGTIVGFVRRSNNLGIAGATVSTGSHSATTNPAGAYSLILPAGVYNVTANATGYYPRTIEGVLVTPNQNTTLNFVMTSTEIEEELNPVTATALKGCFPNPFNPETTILYDILEPAFVTLEIYNARGQKVRSLISESKASGRYGVVFNGRDDRGNPLSSGVYIYRLKAGSFSATSKMMLME